MMCGKCGGKISVLRGMTVQQIWDYANRNNAEAAIGRLRTALEILQKNGVRGRDCPFEQPPAQIPASGIPAQGSSYGCLAPSAQMDMGAGLQELAANTSPT